MFTAIRTFADQMREGVAIGSAAPRLPRTKVRRILILGMGGSAIGGDLLRSYLRALEGARGVDIVVSRGYEPPSVDRSTLVIASSYSGNTEETLAGYDAVRKDAGALLAITTGGALLERARNDRSSIITLPGGMQPRAALAYSFFPLLTALAVRSELFGGDVRKAAEEGTEEAIALVESLARRYSSERNNPARKIAAKIHGHVPVIYTPTDRLDTVGLRWRGQIQENAKHVAFGNVLPEMNHNEINGWQCPPSLLGSFLPIFLRDRDDHPQVARRIDVSRSLVAGATGEAIEIWSEGESLLARLFSLIHLGDWVSFHLAALNGVDPMPVEIIERLKKELGGRKG